MQKLCLFEYFDQHIIKLEPNEIQLNMGDEDGR